MTLTLTLALYGALGKKRKETVCIVLTLLFDFNLQIALTIEEADAEDKCIYINKCVRRNHNPASAGYRLN